MEWKNNVADAALARVKAQVSAERLPDIPLLCCQAVGREEGAGPFACQHGAGISCEAPGGSGVEERNWRNWKDMPNKSRIHPVIPDHEVLRKSVEARMARFGRPEE